MDLTRAITPKSDQLNAEDLLTGPRTFTITGVDEGSSEQPVNVHLAEMPGRPYRPSKSMSRVFAYCWGKETTPYAGRRVTLYRDAEVTFGRDKVGGIKISHLSHIDGPKSVSLTVTRGKRAPHKVDPLPGDPTPVDNSRPLSDNTRKKMFALLAEIDPAGNAETQRAGMSAVLGRPIQSRAELTEDDAVKVIDAVNAEKRKRAIAAEVQA